MSCCSGQGQITPATGRKEPKIKFHYSSQEHNRHRKGSKEGNEKELSQNGSLWSNEFNFPNSQFLPSVPSMFLFRQFSHNFRVALLYWLILVGLSLACVWFVNCDFGRVFFFFGFFFSAIWPKLNHLWKILPLEIKCFAAKGGPADAWRQPGGQVNVPPSLYFWSQESVLGKSLAA